MWTILLAAMLSVGDDLDPNREEEPLAAAFSLPRAVAFTDGASKEWRKERNCVTCHTNGLYLLTRPAAGGLDGEYAQTRGLAKDYLERYLVKDEEPRGQRGAIEGLVSTSAFLALSDMQTEGELDPITRLGLDYAFGKQDEDGAWTDWLKCNWPPYEVDDHFGVSLMVLTMGRVPEEYRSTPVARKGLKRLRTWLKKNPPENLQQTAMTLWATHGQAGFTTRSKQAKWRSEILAAQRKDGGWSMEDLSDERWIRDDGSPQEAESVAYATALCCAVLLETGSSASDEALSRGLDWLRANQRESGRWFTRSPRKDGKHFISHAATNLAVLALARAAEPK